MNLQIRVQTSRLVAEGFDTNRVGSQKEGIAIVTGKMAKVQLALGLAEKVMINGKEVVINKHSRNKFIARTTKDSGVDTIGRFGKAHKIIDAAIQSSTRSTLETLSNHVRAQKIGNVETTHFTTKQGTTDLFNREVVVIETAFKDSQARKATEKAQAAFEAKKATVWATSMADVVSGKSKKPETVLAEQRVAAAKTIQRAFRGFQARKKAQVKLESAVETIQKALPGLKAQAATERAQAAFEAKKAAVWTTSMADVVSGKSKKPETVLTEQRDAAAKTIQRAFRGFQARKAQKAQEAQVKLESAVAAKVVAPRTFISFASAMKAPVPVDHDRIAREQADAELTEQAQNLQTAILAARIVKQLQLARSNHLGEIQKFDQSSLRHVTAEDISKLQVAKEEAKEAERVAYIREANAPVMKEIKARKGHNPKTIPLRELDASLTPLVHAYLGELSEADAAAGKDPAVIERSVNAALRRLPTLSADRALKHLARKVESNIIQAEKAEKSTVGKVLSAITLGLF